MDVEMTLEPEASIEGDCDFADGFSIGIESNAGNLKLIIADDHIEKMIDIFKEWGYIT